MRNLLRDLLVFGLVVAAVVLSIVTTSRGATCADGYKACKLWAAQEARTEKLECKSDLAVAYTDCSGALAIDLLVCGDDGETSPCIGEARRDYSACRAEGRAEAGECKREVMGTEGDPGTRDYYVEEVCRPERARCQD